VYLVVVASLGAAVPGPHFIQERFPVSCLNSRYGGCGVLPRDWGEALLWGALVVAALIAVLAAAYFLFQNFVFG